MKTSIRRSDLLALLCVTLFVAAVTQGCSSGGGDGGFSPPCTAAMTVEPTTVTPGVDHVVEILLTNDEPVRGVQLDIMDDPAQDQGLMTAISCSAEILNTVLGTSFDCDLNDKTDGVEILITPVNLNDIIPAGTDVPVAEVTYGITGPGGPVAVNLGIENPLAVNDQDEECL